MKHPRIHRIPNGYRGLYRPTSRRKSKDTETRIRRICNFMLGSIGTVACALLVCISFFITSLGELLLWIATILAAAGVLFFCLILIKRYAAAMPRNPFSSTSEKKHRYRHPQRRVCKRQGKRKRDIVNPSLKRKCSHRK